MVNHLTARTLDLTQEKIAIVGKLFPNCLTETIVGGGSRLCHRL